MKAGAAPPSGEPKNVVGQADATARAIDGGRVVEGERRLGRPKARFCALASLLWIFPSAGAFFILVPGFRNRVQAGSFIEGLQSVTFEQWIALTILLAHVVFVGLAWHFRRTEPLREEAGWEQNPDQDLRKPG